MNAFLNSVQVFLQDGFMYSILAMGYFISYTTLDFPDLTVEGTVLSGGVVFALLVRAGVNSWLAMLCSFITGALLGSITGLLNVKLKIRPLLCGILVSTGLISVNLVASVLGMGGDIKGRRRTYDNSSRKNCTQYIQRISRKSHTRKSRRCFTQKAYCILCRCRNIQDNNGSVSQNQERTAAQSCRK